MIILFSLLALLSSATDASPGCSSEAEWMVSAAAACLEKQDVGCAKIKLDPLLAKEPNCGSAMFVKGWIVQYFDKKEEEGYRMQLKAMEIDPKLKDFWEKRGKEHESTSSSQSFSNFDVQFYGAQNRDKAWDAVRYLNEMYLDLTGLFGMKPPKKIPVIVFTTEEFMDAWRAPFIGGFFDRRDGKIRIRVDSVPGGEQEFKHRARHEMTHAFLYQLYPHELPAWASEGIAEFCARYGVSQGFWKDRRLEEIRKTRKGYPWLTLADIQRLISEKKGSLLEMYLAYMESEALVIWLAKDRGDSWMIKVLNHLREMGGSFEDAFVAQLGFTPERALERLHHEWD